MPPPASTRSLKMCCAEQTIPIAFYITFGQGEVCMKELAQMVESIFLAKGDHLFHVGQRNEHMYKRS